MWQLGELEFDFLFDKFNIAARVERKERYIRILQILSLKRKKINVDKITFCFLSFIYNAIMVKYL